MTDTSAVAAASTRLAEEIRYGVYAPGQRLPGERTLSERYEFSRVTVRKALGRLAHEGLVTASPQRGWFVAREAAAQPPSALQSFTELARERGLTATARILERTVRPATLDEATRLRIAPAEDVLYLRRLRGMGGKTLCLDTSSMPLTIAGPLVDADLDDASLYERLATLCGAQIYRSAYGVRAASAEPAIAALLGVPVGSPVLVADEVAYTVDGTAVILGVNHHRGDAYRFEADLFRRQ